MCHFFPAVHSWDWFVQANCCSFKSVNTKQTPLTPGQRITVENRNIPCQSPDTQILPYMMVELRPPIWIVCLLYKSLTRSLHTHNTHAQPNTHTHTHTHSHSHTCMQTTHTHTHRHTQCIWNNQNNKIQKKNTFSKTLCEICSVRFSLDRTVSSVV